MFKFLLLTSFFISDFFSVPQGNIFLTIRKAREIEHLIYAWDVDNAERKLRNFPPDNPFYHYLKAHLLFYEGEYGEALREIETAVRKLDSEEVINLYNLIKNTYEETKDFKKRETSHFVIYYAPGKDEILLDMAEETLEKAWKAVGDDLGYFPPGKIRVEIYPFYEDFMRVSTLTRKDIETSGTIALCNYNKIMITSPKATLYGYRWRDTLNHEMVHYFLTRMTHNYAPLWLQEGVAKAEEQRWRRKGPRELSPLAQSALLRAIKKNDFVTFREMIPSFAKLGSAERVTLAFAEVLSMVRMIVNKGGYPLLRKLIMASVKYHGNSDKMVKEIGFRGLKDFLQQWKAYIKSQPLVFLNYQPSERVELRRKNIDEKYFRLGEMLEDRLHFVSAAYEFKKAIDAGKKYDPLLYYKYSFTLFHAGKVDEAEKILKFALKYSPDYESMHTLLGMICLKKKKIDCAEREFKEGLDLNPFDPLIHRGLIKLYSLKGDQAGLEREKKIMKILGG